MRVFTKIVMTNLYKIYNTWGKNTTIDSMSFIKLDDINVWKLLGRRFILLDYDVENEAIKEKLSFGC